MEKYGSETAVVQADVTNINDLQRALEFGRNQFGEINGIIHAAGVAGGGSIALNDPKESEHILAPKLAGTENLNAIFQHVPLDFFILCSSMTAVTGRLGEVDYTAANAYLDSFAQSMNSRNNYKATAINWDTWKNTGMAGRLDNNISSKGITPTEALNAFNILMDYQPSQVLVSAYFPESRFPSQPKNLPEEKTRLAALKKTRTRIPEKPRYDLECMLKIIWERCLHITTVGIHDNFFELKGDSLDAMNILAEIEEFTGLNLDIHHLIAAPTIAEMAAVIKKRSTPSRWEFLVPIQAGGSKKPFFCVHPLSGHVFHFSGLRPYWKPDRPFFGIQAQGFNEKSQPLDRVEDMAAAYLKEIIALQPEGPYFLAGRCFGSMVAFEMAHQLIQKGKSVAALAAVEGTSPLRSCLPSNTLPETVNSSDILEIFNTLNKRAQGRYKGVPLPGKIALFYAKNSKLNRPAYFRDWRKAAENGIECFSFPCGHTDMFRPPVAADLVRCLQGYLNSRDPACR